MKMLIHFLSKLGFWPFVFLFTLLAIVLSEVLIILQSYWLTGEFFNINLLIIGFITPAIDAFIVFTITAFLIQYLHNLQQEKDELHIELKEHSELLRSVIDENPDPVLVKNFDGKFVLVNEACATLYDTVYEEMIGKDDGDYIADQNQAALLRRSVQEVMLSGKTQVIYEDSYDVKTGQRRNFRAVKIPYKNSKDESHLLIVAHDITEKKNKEEDLRFMNYALDKASDASFLVDEKGKILKVNIAASKDLGYSKEELLSMSVFDINTKILKEKWPEEFGRVKEIESSVIETEHQRKDGTRYVAEVRINYVKYRGKEYHLTFSRDITKKKEQEKVLKRLAHFDALTNLPNRVLLADRIEQAIAQTKRRKNHIAVLYIDLDGFKEVNDTYGHDVGDSLLKILALKMHKLLRSGDTIARLGGDEFVALLVDITDRDVVNSFLNRLLVAISQPMRLDGHELRVSASIGITFYPQEEDIGPDQLVRQADQAMYQAKSYGKNRFVLFDDSIDNEMKISSE